MAIGVIVVRELSQAGGGKSSTFTSGYWSCSRFGEAPNGSARRTEQDYVVGGYAIFTHKEGPETVDMVVPEVLRSFYVAGNQGDRRAYPITEIGRQHPPTTSRLELNNLSA